MGDHELLCAVDHALVVFEVASESDVAEYGLLKLVVQRVEGAVHTDASLLLLRGAPLGQHPVHVVLVAFHVREKLFDARTRIQTGDKLHSAFYDFELGDLDGLHAS